MITPESIAQAHKDAKQRSDDAQVTIRILETVDEQNYARQIFDEVWPTDEGTQITANLLQAMVHNGTYVSGVYVDGQVVAAAFAFPGIDSQKHLHLHSHMAAVKEKYRNRNIGSALKWHQRAWALENGYETITWTFDPLVRRNARLNLVKLGVQVFEYFSDFYGDLPDALNAGDPTDRVIAKWSLLSDRVISAARNHNLEIPNDSFPVVLRNVFEEPVKQTVDTNTSVVLAYLPFDIIDVRASEGDTAMEWRMALRAELEPRLKAGWHIEGLTKDGAYVISKEAR
ncbi:MAG TPA: GNAT family N-acetyltransferase [Candidatus Nanopelagicaceae bacterium]